MKTTTCAIILSLAGGVVLVMAPVSAQAVIEAEILANPDPILAKRYSDGAEKIEALRAIALDGNRGSEARITALQELAQNFPDAALAPAVEVVVAPDLHLAVLAAKLLANVAVMSDHSVGHAHADDVPPYLRLMFWRHKIGREGLLRVVNDSRPEIRDISASSLAALSDSAGLALIESGRKSGTYTDTEAVNYYGLADPEVGAPLMQQILFEGSPEAQASAVSYLGSNLAYQALVRDEYLFNSAASAEVRSAAAAALGQYDADFASYATTLTADPSLPPQVYTAVVEGYISQSTGKLQPAQAEALKFAVENYSKNQPNADFSNVLQMLNSVIKQ